MQDDMLEFFFVYRETRILSRNIINKEEKTWLICQKKATTNCWPN